MIYCVVQCHRSIILSQRAGNDRFIIVLSGRLKGGSQKPVIFAHPQWAKCLLIVLWMTSGLSWGPYSVDRALMARHTPSEKIVKWACHMRQPAPHMNHNISLLNWK